jgi:hypothetical protein
MRSLRERRRGELHHAEPQSHEGRLSHAEPRRDAEALIVGRSLDGRLVVTVGGRTIAVTVARCFPWSRPLEFLSLRDGDDNEVALVADPLALTDSSRSALEEALAENGFVFRVTAVLDLDEEVELRTWKVSTDQGERRFQTRLDDWPRKLPDGGLLIRDVTGDLYMIRDVGGLDRKSRERLWAFVD